MTPFWLTPTVLPASVTVVLRALAVLALAETVTEALPLPLVVLSPTQLTPLVLAVQLQPVGAVTVTVLDPPEALKDTDVVDTLYVQVGVVGASGGGGSVEPPDPLRNAAMVPTLAFSVRALSWLAVPVGLRL